MYCVDYDGALHIDEDEQTQCGESDCPVAALWLLIPYGRRIRRERAAGDFSLQVAASSVLTRFVWHPRRQEQVASCVGF